MTIRQIFTTHGLRWAVLDSHLRIHAAFLDRGMAVVWHRFLTN